MWIDNCAESESHGAYVEYNGIRIELGTGASSSSVENRTFWRSGNNHFDFLVLMDSRGAMVKPAGSKAIVDLLNDYFDSIGASRLILSRPMYLTVLPTLLSVLENDSISFGKVITNVGFVDTTPKKKSVLKDLAVQLASHQLGYKHKVLEEYQLSSGEVEILASYQLEPQEIVSLAQRLRDRAEKYYFVNTPLLTADIQLERARPNVFYSQLMACNRLLENLSVQMAADIVDITAKGIQTFDGVHYTADEHLTIFDKIKAAL